MPILNNKQETDLSSSSLSYDDNIRCAHLGNNNDERQSPLDKQADDEM